MFHVFQQCLLSGVKTFHISTNFLAGDNNNYLMIKFDITIDFSEATKIGYALYGSVYM